MAQATLALLAIFGLVIPGAAAAQQDPASQNDELTELRRDIAAERARLDDQQAALDAARARLGAMEERVTAQTGERPPRGVSQTIANPPTDSPSAPPTTTAAAPSTGVQTVGEAPSDQRQVQVAILAEQGGIITKAGRLTLEPNLEYARADRNRVVFRGIEIPQSVLIGVFDINESRQDVLTAGITARLGLTNRLEINGNLPYIYRSDKSVLAPVSDPSSPNAGQIDAGVHDGGIGDVSFGARYQFTDGHHGWPYLIAGVQAIAPTGSNPYTLPRDALGNELKAATGAGSGVSLPRSPPSSRAIPPSCSRPWDIRSISVAPLAI